jgi:acyl-CoA reductase-like NAD-dependent aldehyde dehydrogenase
MKGLLRNHVGGIWVETGRVFENINPVNGSKVCDVSEADSETVDRAVRAARAAMTGELGPAQRGRARGTAAQSRGPHRGALR